MNLYSVLL